MIKSILAIFLVFGCATAVADSAEQWDKNYDKLVGLLQSTTDVGNCKIRLSTDPHSPKGSWEVNFLTKAEQPIVIFEITPPAVLNGRSQVDLEQNHILKYRESDIAGWVNMIVQLNNDEDEILSTQLNKTLPNGTVYDNGPACR